MKLELRDVKVHYGAVEALKGISISVAEGETVSLVGANGAGKSTILKAVSGLIKTSSGEILFNDMIINKKAPQDIVKLGIVQVPEGKRIFPSMTVADNLRMGTYLRKDSKDIKYTLGEVYEHFPVLEERRRQAAGTLSGGEQAMLVIGRALMAKPKLLMLDEPSLGLSPIMVLEIAKCMHNICARNVPILLVEQNAELAFKLSDRSYVIENGAVTLQGKTAELIKNDHVRTAYLGG